MNSFWQDYNNFFPLMSNYRFGDDFAANLIGSSATLRGNNLPEINREISLIGPDNFPKGLMEGVASALDFEPPKIDGMKNPYVIGVGLDEKTLEQRGQANRFNYALNMVGIGVIAISLLVVGIIYLGLVSGEKYIEVTK